MIGAVFVMLSDCLSRVQWLDEGYEKSRVEGCGGQSEPPVEGARAERGRVDENPFFALHRAPGTHAGRG